jgi:hypothetical protein
VLDRVAILPPDHVSEVHNITQNAINRNGLKEGVGKLACQVGMAHLLKIVFEVGNRERKQFVDFRF